MNIYEEYLERLKELGPAVEDIVFLEKILNVARRACLPLAPISRLEIKDKFEFKLSLAPAFALHEVSKAKGDDGYIVYSDANDHIVRHYVDGRIIVRTK